MVKRTQLFLEFDHVNGEKEFDVSQMICHGTKWERIAAEIEKCEVRCANCYKRRTAKRGGWFKSGVVS